MNKLVLIGGIVKKVFDRWTEKECDELYHYVKEGKQWKEVSKHFGRSVKKCRVKY
jgi:hypothetical protein